MHPDDKITVVREHGNSGDVLVTIPGVDATFTVSNDVSPFHAFRQFAEWVHRHEPAASEPEVVEPVPPTQVEATP